LPSDFLLLGVVVFPAASACMWSNLPWDIMTSIDQSITFARAPVTGDHWRRTRNLVKSIDKNQ